MRVLNQREIVTLALYLLGGDKKTFDTEDIAVKSAELAPGKFSWKKYRDNIDQELVRRSLADAKIKLNYIVGSQKEGWMLSSDGLIFARNANSEDWQKPKPRELERDKIQQDREKQRLLVSDAYRLFLQEGISCVDRLTNKAVDDFFRLNDYVSGDARTKKVARIENLFINDPELGDLVKSLAKLERNRVYRNES